MAKQTGEIQMLMIVGMAMLLFCVSGVMAQGIAPTPATGSDSPTLDTGAGFAFPVSWGVIVSSVFGSLVALLLH